LEHDLLGKPVPIFPDHALWLEHDLLGKPVPTFPDHALRSKLMTGAVEANVTSLPRDRHSANAATQGLSIVVPLFNEAATLERLHVRLVDVAMARSPLPANCRQPRSTCR
jgi:hypothetical protein